MVATSCSACRAVSATTCLAARGARHLEGRIEGSSRRSCRTWRRAGLGTRPSTRCACAQRRTGEASSTCLGTRVSSKEPRASAGGRNRHPARGVVTLCCGPKPAAALKTRGIVPSLNVALPFEGFGVVPHVVPALDDRAEAHNVSGSEHRPLEAWSGPAKVRSFVIGGCGQTTVRVAVLIVIWSFVVLDEGLSLRR
jgi:hypothetical protein